MKFPILTLGLLVSTTRAFSPTLAAVNTKNTSSSSSSSSKRMISSLMDMLGGRDKSQLIDPANALPGRQQKMANIDGLRHYVLGNKLEQVPEGHEIAVFANGVS
jgi:hypothetical protein